MSGRPAWELRAARARELAERHPAAAEMLRCYGRLLELQHALYERFRAGAGKETLFAEFVRAASKTGTAEMARQAKGVTALDGSEQEFYTRAYLQPWAEATFAEPCDVKGRIMTLCPCCGRKPQAAVLREEAQGARRNLVCSLCQHEWEFRRLLCPGCGEDRFESLPVFRAEEFPGVRVEACSGCRGYLTAVDMTVDGRAVPLVDELAVLPLHLWAWEQGYIRLQRNLFLL